MDLISFKPNRVQWTWFSLNQTESNELNFWAYVDTLSTSAVGKIAKSTYLVSIC